MYYLKLNFIFIITFLFFCTCAQAEIATGRIESNIIDPLFMDASIARNWCENNRESFKCDILKENLQEIEITENFQVMELKKKLQETEYEVLTIDFQ